MVATPLTKISMAGSLWRRAILRTATNGGLINLMETDGRKQGERKKKRTPFCIRARVSAALVSDAEHGSPPLKSDDPIAVLRDTAEGSRTSQFAVVQAAAASLRMEVTPINMRNAAEIERDFEAFARGSNGGLIVTAGRCLDQSSRTDH